MACSYLHWLPGVNDLWLTPSQPFGGVYHSRFDDACLYMPHSKEKKYRVWHKWQFYVRRIPSETHKTILMRRIPSRQNNAYTPYPLRDT